MVVDITSKEEQKLLGRTKILANASFDGATPKKMKIRKDLAAALKVKDEQVIVRHIKTIYGKTSAHIEAMVYDKVDDAKALEHKKLMDKHTKKEEKSEEKPAEDKPAEEKKEEPVAKEAKTDDSVEKGD